MQREWERERESKFYFGLFSNCQDFQKKYVLILLLTSCFPVGCWIAIGGFSFNIVYSSNYLILADSEKKNEKNKIYFNFCVKI